MGMLRGKNTEHTSIFDGKFSARGISVTCLPHKILSFRLLLVGSTDRPRSVLRFGLVMAQASTDPKGLYYGVEAPSLWKPPPA